MTKVIAIKCKECKNIIYSRAVHDFHYCHCMTIAIDGGRHYTKISFSGDSPEPFELHVNATEEQLYEDWNKQINKYGWIK